MPTYEYKCEACGHAFEKFQSIMAAPIKQCPACGKRKVKRLIGIGAGVIFKGGGFYCTDYRSEGYKSAAKSDSASKPSGDTSATAGKTGSAAGSSSSNKSDSTSSGSSAAAPAPAKPAKAAASPSK